MPFLTAALFIFSIYGLANAIAVLKIGRYFIGTFENRKFLGRIPYVGDLFYCPPCLAFWIGMGVSRLGLSPAAFVLGIWWKVMIVDGLFASGVIYLLHLVAERLGDGLDI